MPRITRPKGQVSHDLKSLPLTFSKTAPQRPKHLPRSSHWHNKQWGTNRGKHFPRFYNLNQKREALRNFVECEAFHNYIERNNVKLIRIHAIMHMSTNSAPDIDRVIEETRSTLFTNRIASIVLHASIMSTNLDWLIINAIKANNKIHKHITLN